MRYRGQPHECPQTSVQQLQAEVARLTERLRIARGALEQIARDDPRDPFFSTPRVCAHDALTRMSVVE